MGEALTDTKKYIIGHMRASGVELTRVPVGTGGQEETRAYFDVTMPLPQYGADVPKSEQYTMAYRESLEEHIKSRLGKGMTLEEINGPYKGDKSEYRWRVSAAANGASQQVIDELARTRDSMLPHPLWSKIHFDDKPHIDVGPAGAGFEAPVTISFRVSLPPDEHRTSGQLTAFDKKLRDNMTGMKLARSSQENPADPQTWTVSVEFQARKENIENSGHLSNAKKNIAKLDELRFTVGRAEGQGY